MHVRHHPMGGRPAQGKKSRAPAIATEQSVKRHCAGGADLARLAKLHWPASGGGTFDLDLMMQLYHAHLCGPIICGHDGANQAITLEVSGYLERFLWPNLDPHSSVWQHIMSIVVLVNLKFREGVSPWPSFRADPARFSGLFACVLELPTDRPELTFEERSQWTHFLIHCFQSLEDDMVRPEVLRLVSLPMWSTLNPRALSRHLASQPQLQQPWRSVQKRRKKVVDAALLKNFTSLKSHALPVVHPHECGDKSSHGVRAPPHCFPPALH